MSKVCVCGCVCIYVAYSDGDTWWFKMGFARWLSGFESWPCYFLAVCLQANHLNSLSFSFCITKTETIIATLSQYCYED